MRLCMLQTADCWIPAASNVSSWKLQDCYKHVLLLEKFYMYPFQFQIMICSMFPIQICLVFCHNPSFQCINTGESALFCTGYIILCKNSSLTSPNVMHGAETWQNRTHLDPRNDVVVYVSHGGHLEVKVAKQHYTRFTTNNHPLKCQIKLCCFRPLLRVSRFQLLEALKCCCLF